MKHLLYSALAAAVLTPCAALAQNPGGEPTYGSVDLEGGFTPDPHSVQLTAGGGMDASSRGPGCIGEVADDPDFDLYYEAGNFPLSIFAVSDADVSLLVNAPDGSWICDDDSGGDLNPRITLGAPQSGLYDIWVGAVGGGNPAATLFITELEPSAGASPSSGGAAPNPGGEPNFGSVSLESGFTNDPYTVSVTAGGPLEASAAAGRCAGRVSAEPDFDLYFEAGDLPLFIYATSGDDISLLINTPDGSWVCDDDTGDGFDPSVRILNPQSGLYDIWVGAVGGAGNPSAQLHISELGAPGY